jgi:uncharacterized phage protein (TIGR01671 family)
MREILFRGKREDNGEWVYGFYSKATDEQHFIDIWDSFICEMIYTEVIHETVGEYTGLKDRDGKRIFEGDIVLRVFTESTGIVDTVMSLIKFERGCFLIAKIEPPPFRMDGYSFYDDYQRLTECNGYFEIIGNIHDAPELLKGVTE